MIELEGEYGKRFIETSGGSGDLHDIEKVLQKIDRIDTENETISQIFDARAIAGRNHLLHASKLALKAIENGESFANSEKIELTCWTAGLRQINKSISRVGVKEDKKEIALLTIGDNREKVKKTKKSIFKELDIQENQEILEINGEKEKEISELFSIPQELLKIYSLQDLVLEKIALLSLET